jgi:hypothetical protein
MRHDGTGCIKEQRPALVGLIPCFLKKKCTSSSSYHISKPRGGERLRHEAPDFPFDRLSGEQPLLYISLGSIFTNQPDFYKQCFAAFAGQDWQMFIECRQYLIHWKLAAFRSYRKRPPLLSVQMDLDHDLSIFFRKYLGSAGTHLPSQQDAHRSLTKQIPPPGIHNYQPQGFAFLHVAHRRGKLLPTLAPGECEKQEPITPYPMPWGMQDDCRYHVCQDADRPRRPGMVDTRVDFVHQFALVR